MARNIVLLVLDTVRKDYFDEFAKSLGERSDTTFTQCRSASSWSVPSHTSIFTGKLPSKHDVHSESFGSALDFGAAISGDSFLDGLSDYNTIGISSNIYINKRFGFDRLFDEFIDHSIGGHWNAVPFPSEKTEFSAEDSSGINKWITGLSSAFSEGNTLKNLYNGFWIAFGDQVERLPIPRVSDNGAKANAESLREFMTESNEPAFAFVNFMDAHNPLQNSVVYDQDLHSVPNSWSSNKHEKWELLIEDSANEEYTSNYRELYGAAIDYLDRVIDDLISDIQSRTNEETTVIVTADHGHNLGYKHENGNFHHTASLSEGILHVPLEIINPPSDFPSEVQDIFSQVNIPDLIRSIKAEKWDPSILDNQPVVAENIGLLGEGNEVNYEGDQEVNQEHWNRMIRCGYNDMVKYEWDSLGNKFRYRLESEKPCFQSLEETDCEIPPAMTSVFEDSLNDYKQQWATANQDLAFDEELTENLKDLGYL